MKMAALVGTPTRRMKAGHRASCLLGVIAVCAFCASLDCFVLALHPQRRLGSVQREAYDITSVGESFMAYSVKEAMDGILLDAESPEAMPTLLWKQTMMTGASAFQGLNDTSVFNQFERHEAFTTKNGLAQILAKHPMARGYFPKTFDMDQDLEREPFIVDFRRHAALRVVRQHLALTDKLGPGGYECCLDMIEAAMMTLQQWQVSPDSGGDMHRNIPGSSWQQLVRYSELSPDQLSSGSRPGFESDGLAWGTLPAKQGAELEKLVSDVEEACPQASLQYDSNVWIVKPHAMSKGEGIWVMRSMPDILQHCQRWSHCVVQKYIEKPLLMAGRKFDFRQWVLITSFEPLKVFVFSEPYCRVCQNPYNPRDLDDLQSHLSNWHVNRNGFEACVSLDQFKDELEKMSGSTLAWEQDIQPQMKRIILDVCNNAADKVVKRTQCFQLLGFDFMLDSDYRPWLMEVNAYPGCDAARSFPFLHRMLRRMTRRMLEIVCLRRADPDGQALDWIPLTSDPSRT